MITQTPELMPVRMLNEHVYCPRLFYLEWVQGEWAENLYTEDGSRVHKRVDKRSGTVAPPDDERPFEARAVSMSAPLLGLSTRADLIEGEGEGGGVVPVEYKRGKPAPTPERVWPPERIQLCAQALVLRENGYQVERGSVYFASTRERVEVPIDAALVEATQQAIQEARQTAEAKRLPPPLQDSPKCGGCSLNVICLPDETSFVDGVPTRPRTELRRFVPARADGQPVYLQAHGARAGISNDRLVVRSKERETLADQRLEDTTQVNLLGNVQLTAPAIQRLCERGIPVSFFGYGGWYYGRLIGADHKNVELRHAQHQRVDDEGFCLRVARRIVDAKVANSRTLLRRNHQGKPRRLLDALARARKVCAEADSLETLLGVEGSAARVYFEGFGELIRGADDGLKHLDFSGRNRRPPRDPVNAMLSFAYALLTKDWSLACAGVGLDPYLGFYHQPRYGRPSLALDLMEEFRPLVADSVVLGMVNNGVVGTEDFVVSSLGVAMKPHARKKLIQSYERRMDQLVTHPVFAYRVSYRRIFEVQARLFSRFILGDLDSYPPFLTR